MAQQGCRCQADPPERYGPYYQWSRAIAGKTISRRLDEREATLYRSWIENRRHLEQIVAEMAEVSAAAGEILLRQDSQALWPLEYLNWQRGVEASSRGAEHQFEGHL